MKRPRPRSKPVRPNAGIAAEYRRKLCALLDEMARSYAYWIKAAYRANPPRLAQDQVSVITDPDLMARAATFAACRGESVILNDDGSMLLAMDATPAQELQRELRKLGGRWEKRLDAAAPQLARWFMLSSTRRSEAVLRKILRDGGISVRFTMSPTVRDVLGSIVNENVSLIKSIPMQFHSQVEGLVMRSVQTGRDLHGLTRDLQKQFGVSRRRAERIAIDQNNKATSAMMRVRQTELGIEEGVWLHSHAGKEPRPTHLANHGKRFSIAEGWFDPDPKVRRRIWPGELIECKCTWKPVVRGFS